MEIYIRTIKIDFWDEAGQRLKGRFLTQFIINAFESLEQFLTNVRDTSDIALEFNLQLNTEGCLIL